MKTKSEERSSPHGPSPPPDPTNHFLQLLWSALRHRIVPLCAAILRIGHLPRSWRDATGIVLHKPKKADYTHPKAYRLILKGRAAVEAVAAAVDVVKRQHRIGNHFVFGLAFNIAGAFPSVNANQLDRNLRSKNGSALSPITYCLYNTPALEAAEKRGRSCGFGWIDDLNLFAWGKTVSEAADNLRAIIPNLESWSSTHKLRFEPTKSDLVLFLPPTEFAPVTLPTITLSGAKLPYSPSLTMLRNVLNERLTFKLHAALCAAKASTALNGVRALLNAKSGVTIGSQHGS
ncbi:hypothetical protein JCM8097_007499 [Rhodosporidiobolus ruineniae]